jgi:outer membrane lipoprotein-sorting protein
MLAPANQIFVTAIKRRGKDFAKRPRHADEPKLKRKGHFWARRTLFFAMRFGHMNRMNPRLALALASLFALAVAAPVAAQELRPRLTEVAAPASLVTLEGAERAEALAQANRTLNAAQRLQGRFVQSSPDGSRASGAFYMQRPGRLRFEYDPPATLLIVADGSVVAMRDTALRTTERTPLRSTPLHLILAETVDLERSARIVRVSRSGPWMMITARDRSGQTDGTITLQFYGPEAALRSWDVIDATGARTRIALSDLTQPASLDRRLFRLEDVVTRGRRPGR